MLGPSALTILLSEGAPVVRLFRSALRRDPTASELDGGRELLREGGSLLPLAASLIKGREFQRVHRRAWGADELLAYASSSAAIAETSLLPGLLPGMPPDELTAYALWRRLYEPTTEAPRDHDRAGLAIAMAVGDTEVEAALQSIASLRRQNNTRWTLHLATRLLSQWPQEMIRSAAADARIIELPCTGHDPLHVAIDAAVRQSDLVILLEPGDVLAQGALGAVIRELADSGADMLTTDEDVLDPDGERRLPRFKPAWSPISQEPPGQLAVYRSRLLREAAAAPDRDFDDPVAAIAAAAARLADRLVHLPAILCHRPYSRRSRQSRASAPVQAPNLTTTIIVPVRDRPDLLAACADGVLHRTSHDALELLIIDNGSEQPETLSLLKDLTADQRVRVLPAPGPFNFAHLNNIAAEMATGDLLVLLNNDIEVRDGAWLTRLGSLACRPDVGAVGARLLYPDGTIQHAGILLGPDGAATHVGRHFPADDPGYLGRFEQVAELSAVTGACLAIRRDVWRGVGGMDERLAVTFNDVDLCLRVRAAGLRVLWTPHATLVHHEAQTRGHEADDPVKLERFQREQAIVRETWGRAVDEDPFLNPNLLAMPSGHLVLTRPRLRAARAAGRLPGRGEGAIPPARSKHPADPLESADGDNLGSTRPDL